MLLKKSGFRFQGSAIALLLFVLSVAIAGCGATNDRISLSGKVQLDGKPLDQGAIQFEPVDKTSKLNAGAVITDGVYRVPAGDGVMPGKYLVMITSTPKDTRKAEEIMKNPG